MTDETDLATAYPTVGSRVVIEFPPSHGVPVWKGRTGAVKEVRERQIPGLGLTHYVEFDKPYGRNGHHQTGAWFPAEAVHRV